MATATSRVLTVRVTDEEYELLRKHSVRLTVERAEAVSLNEAVRSLIRETQPQPRRAAGKKKRP